MKTKDLKFVDFEGNKISNTQLRTINGGGSTTTGLSHVPNYNAGEEPTIGDPKGGQVSSGGAVTTNPNP